MSILTQLKTLNITPDQLRDLNKSGIIRIEKRLKAEVKFNDALTINEVEEVLSLLKNNRTELELLYNSYFNFLREIIENPNELITFKTITDNELELSEDFHEFISTYFEKELELYVINCNKETHYYALYSLLNYKDILSESLLDYILESLRKKIKIGFETLQLKPEGPYDKLDYVVNPYFYRCITKIAPLAVENDVIDLMNTIVKSNLINDFRYKTLFAFGEFKSSRVETAKIITGNKRVAIKKGISERCYGKDEFPKKGGTVKNSNKTYQSPNNSTSSNSKASSEKEKSSSFGIKTILKIVIGIFILSNLVTGIIVPLWMSFQSPEKDSNHYDIEKLRENIREEKTDSITDFVVTTTTTYDADDSSKNKVFNYLKFTNSLSLVDEKFSKVYSKIQYFQSSRMKILKEISTDFEMEGTHFKNKNYPQDSKSKVVIKNQNKNNIIALIKTKVGCVVKFIPSMKKCIVRQRVEGITLYVGKSPQIITCETKKGEIIKGFRFNDWSLGNQQVIYRYTYVNQIKDQINLIITNNKYGIIKE